MEIPLFDYQIEAIERLKENTNYALFFRMGRGKTLPTLVFLEEYIKHNPDHKILIIAPLSVAQNTWDAEIEKWDLKLTYTKVLHSKKVKALQEDVNIYITNRESVTWLHTNNYKQWDIVVIDELSSFKDTKSKRYKSLNEFKYQRIIGLTGSPTSNTLIDLWAQMNLIKQGILFTYKTNFLKKYFVPVLHINNIPVKWKPNGEYVKEEIFLKIKPNSMYKESVEIPTSYIDVEIILDVKENKMYRELERKYILGEIVAESAVALNSKLRQLASGSVINEEGGLTKIHTRKLEKLKEFIELQQGNTILIWYNFISSKNEIIEFLEAEKISYTLDDVNGWNNNQYQIFLSHPKSMGMGVNLQQGGHVILWYELTYSLEEYEQANARLARTGQSKNVEIFHFLVKGTIEILDKKNKDNVRLSVLNSLKLKNINQNEFLEQYKKAKGYV